MSTGEGRGRNIEPTDRTLRSEGPPSEHYLALTGIEQYSALAGINTALQDMSNSLSSAESTAEELMQENTKRQSITDELVESTKSLPIVTEDPIKHPLVQQRIEQFESRSRSQSTENLTMASAQADDTHNEGKCEHLGADGEDYDYDEFDSGDELPFSTQHDNFEIDQNKVDLSQQITGPNKEFDDKIQPHIAQFQSELKDMVKQIVAGPPDGQSFSNIKASMVLDKSSGATTKNAHNHFNLPPPVTNSAMHVPSQHTDKGSAKGGGGGIGNVNSNIRANVGSTSNEWTFFQESVRVLGSECEQELQDLRKILCSSPTVPNIKYCMKEIEKNLEKLKRTVTRGEEMALKMSCPNRAEVNKYINSHSKAFSQLEVHAEELLESKKPPAPQDPSILAIGSLAQNLLGAAYAKPIELPEYDGECISDYSPFQKKFQYVIAHCNTPKELWAQHLENSLKGKAKQYIGTKGSWFNKYEELWAHLDNKYANRWNIATEAVQNFFFQPEPEEDRKQTVDWFYTMKHNLDSLINLGLSMEEVGVNLILQRMPEVHAKEV